MSADGSTNGSCQETSANLIGELFTVAATVTATQWRPSSSNGSFNARTALSPSGFLSYMAEAIVFFDLGLSFFGGNLRYNWALIGVSIAVCLVS